MSDRHQTTPYPLRMPEELKAQLKEAAAGNHRSMNAEIVARLQESFGGGLEIDKMGEYPLIEAWEHLERLRTELDRAMGEYKKLLTRKQQDS
ncbi:Arc family DNA-binding protein [Halomonas sp. 1390]|uniref:Arc family DNA-binding protein n=1 Tax=Halomonas sp. B23F22_3 TaxID=3459516 RepID=UPI00373F2BD3